MRSRWWAALALVGLVVTGCGTETGAATEDASHRPTRAYVIHGTGTLPEKLDPADYPDAPLLARTSHQTLDETMRMLARQQLYGEAVEDVRRQHRATFSSEGVEGDGHFLVFTDAPAPEELATFETLPFDTVVYTGAPATTAQLERLMETAIGELDSQLGGISALQSRLLHDGSGVEVAYNPGRHTDAEAETAERATRESLRETFGDSADLVEFVRDRTMNPLVAE